MDAPPSKMAVMAAPSAAASVSAPGAPRLRPCCAAPTRTSKSSSCRVPYRGCAAVLGCLLSCRLRRGPHLARSRAKDDEEVPGAAKASSPPRAAKAPEREACVSAKKVMGWANWPPTNLQQVMNLYGGTRRFLIVNVPLLFVGLGANLLGSFSALLSLDAFTPLVRSLRLDGVYAVRGLKRHYIDGLSCTFTYPGDWVYDASLEISRYRRQEKTLTLGGGRNTGAPLPLVAVCPQEGSDASVALYAVPAAGSTMSEALGSPEQAQSTAGTLALGYLPARKGKEAKADLVSAKSIAGDQDSYQLQWRVVYSEDGAPAQNLFWDVWASLQLTTLASGKPYLLVLAGIASASSDAAQRARVEEASKSLAALASEPSAV
ncbi:unnamed protein product [Symbiodinium sp. CCMP2592]|nr:unnamed protein product [Symbiodinium sp. CCMP2592]